MEKLRNAVMGDARVQQGIDWYRRLPARDQMIVRLVAVLAALAILFSLFVAPLIRKHTELSVRLEDKISFYNLMAENGARFGGGSQAGASANKPLLAVVSQEAKKSGIALTRYEQDGTSLRVWVDDAGFDEAIAWIENLARRQGVIASQVNIDRDNQQGKADFRITFTQGG